MRGRKPRPWFRKQTQTWHVMINGTVFPLGRDEQMAQAVFRRIMTRLGRDSLPEERAVSTLERFAQEQEFVDRWLSVYFIRNTNNGCVKIGVAEDVHRRFREIQAMNVDRLALLGFIKAQSLYERHLHHRFRHLRVRGEWFRGEPELLAAIDEHLSEEAQ